MIVVTGGAGFIGSNIIKGLNDIGISDIIVVDDLPDGDQYKNLNNLKFSEYVDKLEFIETFNSFRKIDAIFHQGACSSTTETNVNFMLQNNYFYSKKLLNMSIEKKIPFIYASSASVYGDGSKGFSEKLGYEDPLNIYAFSKTLFDRYVNSLLPNLKSQVLGLRYFNVYGPQENHKGKMASVAYHLYQQLKDSNQMNLFKGSQKFKRDFIYVKDVVKINLFFLDKQISGIFNCGTGRAESFHDISSNLKLINGSGDIEFIDFPEELIGKYQKYTKADITNLRAVGYLEDFYDLEIGLRDYYSYLEKGGYLDD